MAIASYYTSWKIAEGAADMAAVGAGLLLEAEGNGRFSVVLHYADGTEEHLPSLHEKALWASSC